MHPREQANQISNTHVCNYYFGNVIEGEATYVHITLVNFVAFLTETGTPAKSVAILLSSISPLTTKAAVEATN